jgi:transposase
MRPLGSPEALQRRRERAVTLLQEGYPLAVVARKVRVDIRSVQRWKRAFQADGNTGICALSVPGRPPRLEVKERGHLVRILLAGAQAAGFPTDLWTCQRVTNVIKREFGVQYHLCHVSRILHSLGWSPQRPSRRAVERNESEIKRWLKEDWSRIKKKRGG